MKKNLLVAVFVFLFFATGAYAQTLPSLSECRSIEDTLHYLQHVFIEPKDKFVGKPVQEVINIFKQMLPIKFAVSRESSPWIDKNGISYVSGITIFYQDVSGAQHKGKQIYFEIFFDDTHVTDDDFTQSVAEADWDNYDKFVTYFYNFIVKEIDIHIWDWDTKTKIE